MTNEIEKLQKDKNDLIDALCDIKNLLAFVSDVISENAGEMRPIIIGGLGRMLSEGVDWIDAFLPPDKLNKQSIPT